MSYELLRELREIKTLLREALGVARGAATEDAHALGPEPLVPGDLVTFDRFRSAPPGGATSAETESGRVVRVLGESCDVAWLDGVDWRVWTLPVWQVDRSGNV